MSVYISDEVRNALANCSPVVALETAVLTAGLPRTPWNESFGERPIVIDADIPINVALAQSMTLAIKSNGAIPAWIAVVNGTLRIGLSPEEIVELCNDPKSGKVSLSSFAQTIQSGNSAGTTVSATLHACRLISDEHPIRVFATGGIGGIHKNWTQGFDVSSDLTALATTPTCVVSSGAKSILDIHATVESLETIGVPVLGLGSNTFPRFIENNLKTDPKVHKVDSPSEVADICKYHWLHLQMDSAILATIPVPNDVALENGTVRETLDRAEHDWAAMHLPSTTRTTFLLNQLANITKGKSLVANLALLCNNAAVAAEIAIELSTTPVSARKH